MQITAIKLTEEEENQIFNTLIEKFDLNRSDIFEKGQTIEFSIDDLIELESTLELYNEGYVESDTNAPIINSQCVIKFKLTFYNFEGNEVKAEMINTSGKCLEDRISEYYRIN